MNSSAIDDLDEDQRGEFWADINLVGLFLWTIFGKSQAAKRARGRTFKSCRDEDVDAFFKEGVKKWSILSLELHLQLSEAGFVIVPRDEAPAEGTA